MELARIEELIEKYFQGETTLVEEKQLKQYFSTETVAAHLEHYKPLFNYLTVNDKELFNKELSLPSKKRFSAAWIAIAASLVFFGVLFAYLNYKPSPAPAQVVSDLGSFDSPEEAFEETQKALALLSENVNEGVKSIAYLNEYEKSKQLIFKK
jgi:hypothetical protein